MASYKDEIDAALNEALKIGTMSPVDQMKLPGWSRLATLPHWSGRGEFVCGNEAYQALRQVAYRGLSNSAYAGKIDKEDVFKEFRTLVIRRFLTEKVELDNASAAKVIEESISIVAARCGRIVHLIPVHLGHASGVDQFNIGAVHFFRRAANDTHLQDAIRTYCEISEAASETDEQKEFRFMLAEDTKKYYETFEWIASIEIDGCDTNTSRRKAEKLSRDALNCLHLLLGNQYSNHMRACGPAFSTDRRGLVWLSENNKVEVQTSTDWLGHALGENWWSMINDDGGSDLIALMGTALEAGNRMSEPSEVAQRFLDAAGWYGEATRDGFAASSIIKYAVALERLFITKKIPGENTDLLTSRAAAFLYSRTCEDITGLKSRFKEMYKYRSNLVHGKQTPFDPQMEHLVFKFDEDVRLSIQQYIYLAREDGVRDGSGTIQRLEDWLGKIEEIAAKRAASGCDRESPEEDLP